MLRRKEMIAYSEIVRKKENMPRFRIRRKIDTV